MLQQVQNPHIHTRSVDVDIYENVHLHVELLEHAERSAARTLLFIHGGGAATNHTIVRRPSRWLIDRNLFDRAILPDRRGNGGSSPITELMTFEDQAEDMRRLLDALGERGPLTAMGISYGGPIALTLAALDDRIQRVILLASSPTMNEMAWPWNWLMKSGLLTTYMRWLYKREVGKAEPHVFDLDVAYETASTKEDWAQFRQALRHTPRDRLQSLLLEFQATSDPANAEIPDWVQLKIPVLQIIGSRDETWGGDLPQEYRARFPNLHRVVIPGMGHKDAVRHADVFLEALARELRRATVSTQTVAAS
jgi:pimeloyl-ACP methyl ester carboxylesterase